MRPQHRPTRAIPADARLRAGRRAHRRGPRQPPLPGNAESPSRLASSDSLGHRLSCREVRGRKTGGFHRDQSRISRHERSTARRRRLQLSRLRGVPVTFRDRRERRLSRGRRHRLAATSRRGGRHRRVPHRDHRVGEGEKGLARLAASRLNPCGRRRFHESCQWRRPRQLDFEGGECAGASSRGASGEARAHPRAGFVGCSGRASDDARRASEVGQAACDPRCQPHSGRAHSTRLCASESASTRAAPGGVDWLDWPCWPEPRPKAHRPPTRSTAREARSLGEQSSDLAGPERWWASLV